MRMQTSVMFMGTPEFALPSLERLAVNGWPIAAVVTQPDRPRGRGRSRIAPPVKDAALRLGLPVLQPERVRDPAFLDTCRALAPDVIVVAAFGQILPAVLLEIPRFGCINVHPSLLPKYRGAAPMNWTLIRGESVTGVTIMRMNEAMDAGDILIQEETPIDPGEDYGALHDRLAILGAGLLARALDGIVSGTLTGTPQNPSGATFAPKIGREDGLIRWDAPADAVVNLIRGLSPTPGAWTRCDGKILKVFRAEASPGPVADAPGTVGEAMPGGLPVAVRGGRVCLTEVQLENKKRLPIGDFLRGQRLASGSRLG